MFSIPLVIGCIIIFLIGFLGPSLNTLLQMFKPINKDIQTEINPESNLFALLAGKSTELMHVMRRALKMAPNFSRIFLLLEATLLLAIACLFFPTDWLLLLTGIGLQVTIFSLIWALHNPLSLGTSLLKKTDQKNISKFLGMGIIWQILLNHEKDILTSLIFEPLSETSNLSKYPEYLESLQDVFLKRKMKFMKELNQKASSLQRKLKYSFYLTLTSTLYIYIVIFWILQSSLGKSVLNNYGLESITYFILSGITTVSTGNIYSIGSGTTVTLIFVVDVIVLIFGFLQFFGNTIQMHIEEAFDGYISFINQLINETAILKLWVISGEFYNNWKWIKDHYSYSERTMTNLRMHERKRDLDS